jgi:hypothetical protein
MARNMLVYKYLPEAWRLLDEARKCDKKLKLEYSGQLDALLGVHASILELNKRTKKGFRSRVEYCWCAFTLESTQRYDPNIFLDGSLDD